MFVNVLYLTVYLCDRAYGGPEEGGWWFDTGEVVKVLGPFAGPDREAKVERAKARVDKVLAKWNHGRREISSVVSDGRYGYSVDSKPGEDYPQERPYYC